MSTASVPTWKRGDTDPPYTAFLQQANAASVLPLTAASSVEFVAQNTGASLLGVASSLRIKGTMTIASAAQGMVQYVFGASDLILADAYNVEYEITWQNGTTRTVPGDSYDTFWVIADLEGDPLASDPI
jgi:hypothetical protein